MEKSTKIFKKLLVYIQERDEGMTPHPKKTEQTVDPKLTITKDDNKFGKPRSEFGKPQNRKIRKHPFYFCSTSAEK